MRHGFLYCLLFGALLFPSCEDDGAEIVAKVNEEIAGKYVLSSATWSEHDMDGNVALYDLDGDGVFHGNDILEELGRYEQIQYMRTRFAAYVSEANERYENYTIGIQLPLQDIRIADSGYEVNNVVAPFICFEYWIDQDGEVVIESKVDYSTYYESVVLDETRYSYLSNPRITEIKDGSFSVTIESLAYYDFKTRRIKHMRVDLRYTRV